MVFGVETALWPTAAKKAGKWYRGVLEADTAGTTYTFYKIQKRKETKKNKKQLRQIEREKENEKK